MSTASDNVFAIVEEGKTDVFRLLDMPLRHALDQIAWYQRNLDTAALRDVYICVLEDIIFLLWGDFLCIHSAVPAFLVPAA